MVIQPLVEGHGEVTAVPVLLRRWQEVSVQFGFQINREYEAWFISAVESLRGISGISPDASSHPAPETVRDAKGALEACMVPASFYSPTVDQATLTAHVDLTEVHRRCRSFRKMAKEFGILAEAAGASLENWPPDSWL